MSQHPEIIDRINKTRKYIEQHLSENVALTDLAAIANYSPFHFQRIFKSIIGETPKQYTKRLRLEGSAHDIYLNGKTSLLEIALNYGFTSLPAFSRAFKNYYEVSPDEFRRGTEKEKLTVIQNKTKATLPYPIHPESFLSQTVAEDEELAVEVVHLPPEKLVYIPITLKDLPTLIGSYERLEKWMKAQKLMRPHTKTYGMMRDYPLFTALEKCRYYTCMTVDHQPQVNGEVHYMERPGGIYASFKIHGGINELVRTTTQFSHHWLPYSGYQMRHVPAILSPDQNPLTIHPHENTYQFYLGLKRQG